MIYVTYKSIHTDDWVGKRTKSFGTREAAMEWINSCFGESREFKVEFH